MKKETKQRLIDAMETCNREDRSTEYMIQFMQDYAGVDCDCVMNFLQRVTYQLD